MSKPIRRFLLLFVALVPAAWLGFSATDTPSSYVLQAFRAENAFVVMPGETREVRVRIQRQDGSGVPGVSVIFGAPRQGPSGTFAGAVGESGSFIRVTSTASGDASAMLTTNQIEGMFEVGIAVEGFAAFNQFSFTNTSSPPTTPATPQEVRNAVLTQLLGDAPLNQDLQLHGPVFVRAGSIVKTPVTPDPVRQDQPVAVERDSWLMWVDEAPDAPFAHEALWVLLDASLRASEAVEQAAIHLVRWYPVVAPPSRNAEWTLNFPANSHPESFNPDLFPNLFPDVEPLPAALGVEQSNSSEACIIAISGPGLRGSNPDIANYIKTFTSAPWGVPPGRVFTNKRLQGAMGQTLGYQPVSTRDIQDLVNQAVKAKCKKVFFLMSSHGLDVNRGGGVVVSDGGSGTETLSFESYANILSGLKAAGAGVKLCLFQSSCYSGQISPWLSGLGLPASIVTSADENNMAWEDPAGRGSIYLSLYLQSKLAGTAADANGDGEVSDDEAETFIAARVQPNVITFETGEKVERIFAPGPGVVSITGNPDIEGRWMGADDLYIAGKDQRGSICIRRPRSMPNDVKFTGQVSINDATIAANRRFSPTDNEDGVKANEINFTLEPGRDSVKLSVVAKGCGITRFRFRGNARINGRTVDYSGTARIQVGHFNVIDPDAPKGISVFGPAPETPVESVTLQQGVPKKLVLVFYGRDFDNTAPLRLLKMLPLREAEISAFSADEAVVTVSPKSPKKGALVKRVEVVLTGHKAGDTFVDFSLSPADLRIRNRRPAGKRIKVKVVAPPEKKVSFLAPCGESTTQVAINVMGVKDIDNHNQGVGALPSASTAKLMLDRGNAYLTDGPPQLADMMGSVNCGTGQINLSGTTGTRIPGYPNTPGRAIGRIPLPGTAALRPEGVRQQSNAVQLTYVLGEGVFPGQPVEYDLELVPPDEGGGDCAYKVEVDPTPAPFAGAYRTAFVSTAAGCPWSARSTAAGWLLMQGSAQGADGAGPGAIELTFLTNEGGPARNAVLTIAGLDVPLAQQGADASGPVIDSVVNGASFSSGVAGASWITIGGWNFSAATRIWMDADFNGDALPTSLDGVSVTVNGAPAYVFFISPKQLNVLVDQSLRIGQPAEVVVSTPAGNSNVYRAVALPADPALFQFDPEGRRYAAAVHADGTFLGKPGLFSGLTTRPASAGDVVLFFGTGFGETNPPTPSGSLVERPAPLARPVFVQIGGRPARVLFAGLTASGLYQFNIEIPAGLAPGDHLLELYLDALPIQAGAHITVE